MTSQPPEDFLPIELEAQTTDLTPLAALLWVAFFVALASSPAVVIAAWRWAL